MNKPLKVTLIVIGSLMAFIFLVLLLVTLLAGPIAKSYVNGHAEELIGRKAHVEHVGLNLFSGHVAIHDLAIYEENGTDKFAGFDTLDVKVGLMKLLASRVDVKHVTLDGLDVKVLQDGERFNFTSLLDFFASDSAEVEEEQDTTPSSWVIDLHNIRISDGRVYYADLQRDSHWDLNNLNLIVPDFSIGGSEKTDAGLSLALADGGLLKADAAYDSKSNDFKVKLCLEQFSLEQVKPYVADMAHLGTLGGRLNVGADVEGNLDRIMDMEIKATVNLDGVDVRDNNNVQVAALDHLAVEANQIVLSKNLYDIASVEIRGVKAHYELFRDSSDTFSRFLKPSAESSAAAPADTAAAAPASAPADEQPMRLSIGHFLLHETSFTYADHTMPDDFVFPVTKIRLEADNLTLSGNNSAQFFALLPNGGTAMLNWNGNISEWKRHQSLRLNIKNLHLTDLSPYMVAYLGQPFTDGVFSFTSFNTINNSNLNGKNTVDIYKPTVGERRKDVKDAMRLPVKAALYILKDKDDKVMLDVPIAGNIDNPEFNYMKLVWKTLGNLLVKVATSPARALGNAMGLGGSDDLFIAIDSTQIDFTSEQYYQIDKVAEMAKQDESIVLNFDLQTRTAASDSVASSARQRRNGFLMRHLQDIGVKADQVKVTTAEPNASLKAEGYAVTTAVAGFENDQ